MDLLERVRLILRGGSVIDWYRLGFERRGEVTEFLRANGYSVEHPGDADRVRDLLRMASQYLREDLDMEVPADLADPVDLAAPFLAASSRERGDAAREHQRTACILLKIVHTINHLEARELRLGLALSELEVFARVEMRVQDAMADLVADGQRIIQFDMSRKTRDSTITKLLSKRRATAAQILDRLRFRVIVAERRDLPVVIAAMTRALVPYNYAIPEESTNDLIDFARFARSIPQAAPWLGDLQFRLELEREDPLGRDINECSADEFRMINFVADIPVRVDDALALAQHAHLRHLGRVVFLNAEFQIYDQATWASNERNAAASHDAYKERQRDRVKERLYEGLERLYGAAEK